MDTDELEALLEGQTETQTLDFKGECAWDAVALARDILAMTNVQDGGFIVIGVEDGTFVRQGVSDQIAATYDFDAMKDAMSGFADPYVDFRVSKPKDRDGKQYVVIRVMPFHEVPVICKRDSRETQKGVIYYRNMDRRPESAAVSNSYDMRNIVEVAVSRRMKRVRELGFVVESGDKEKLDSELEGL